MSAPRNTRRLVATLAAAAAVAVVAACGSSTTTDEIVITCATCQESATDPFLQYNFDAAERFNRAHAGRYRIETLQNASAGSGDDRLQYYQRLALADDLPDLFQLNSSEIASLARTGKLHDFAPDLAAAPAWAETFQPHSFDALTGDGGEVRAIPQQRDPIGIYYNADEFAAVGYPHFPATWDEFEDAAARLRGIGKSAVALDGDWATMLMWTNLIGTQPSGGRFLSEEIATGSDYGDNPAVVAATERLRKWHNAGYVNSDAFSGEFQNAAAAYLSATAAAVPNGPWFVKTNLATDIATAGLYEATRYSVSPGWEASGQGLIVVSGAGWVSAAVDAPELDAVNAFLQFITSTDEVLEQARRTGANPATVVQPAEFAAAGLEPLASSLVTASSGVAYTYPHVRVHGPGGFGTAWKNLWPAYVNGEMSTTAFLTRLSRDAAAG